MVRVGEAKKARLRLVWKPVSNRLRLMSIRLKPRSTQTLAGYAALFRSLCRERYSNLHASAASEEPYKSLCDFYPIPPTRETLRFVRLAAGAFNRKNTAGLDFQCLFARAEASRWPELPRPVSRKLARAVYPPASLHLCRLIRAMLRRPCERVGVHALCH